MKGIISIQSHVVYGHAGNSSAVFPLQRMGFEVWPIHTVQFSNHTQYKQGWTGKAFSAEDITTLISGIEKIDQLQQCEAVLMADVIVPNQFELSQFVGMEINNLEDAVAACKAALTKGPKVVLVKHLHSVSDEQFTMMLATEKGCFIAQRPHLPFDLQPVGVGDLISSLFTGGLLKGWTPEQAFEHAHNACYGVLKETHKRGEWELQTIAAQEELVAPTEIFPAQAV